MTGLTDYSDWLWLLAFNGAQFPCVTVGFHASTGHILMIPVGLMPFQSISLQHAAAITIKVSEIVVGNLGRPGVTSKTYGDDRFNRLF